MPSEARVKAAGRKAAFASGLARSLAEQALGDVKPFSPMPAQRLPSAVAWFSTADALCAVSESVAHSATNEAIAYGLHHCGDRRLVVIVPKEHQRLVTARAPWLIPVKESFTYDLSGPKAMVEPLELEDASTVLSLYVDAWGYTAEEGHGHEASKYLDERASWVSRLVDWAESDVDLDAAHRKSYLAWHCRGRSVLRIKRSRAGLRVEAGVDGASQRVFEELRGPIDAATAHDVIVEAAKAVSARLRSEDDGHREHWLQSILSLRADRVSAALGTELWREYPAWRPYLRPKGRSYLDFLGADEERLHVVETKIGPFPGLVLQGLDYWIWATANFDALATRANTPPKRREVVIDFVLAPRTEGAEFLSPYTSTQMKAVDHTVQARFFEVRNWEDEGVRIALVPVSL